MKEKSRSSLNLEQEEGASMSGVVPIIKKSNIFVLSHRLKE